MTAATTMGIRPSFGYETMFFSSGRMGETRPFPRPVLRDASAASAGMSEDGGYSDDFDRWLEAEAARRLAEDDGVRISFEDVLAMYGLAENQLETGDVPISW